MADNGPALALQDAILTRLRADTTIKTLLGSPIPRIRDRVENEINYPYVSFGSVQLVPDLADCIDGSEFFVTLDVWSQEPGYAECKSIAHAIRLSLNQAEASMPLDFYDLLVIETDGDLFRRDTDNTSHAVCTYRALLEPKE